ncbi:MAG: hypothetical protein CFE37_07970 [Alphaproteobacteria bacterium PA4]|nr:MAG: hypothetical protein CFE37_07970 [Alphaproteobacteria bacterium PA4]
MIRLISGSIFRSSFVLALSGAVLLACASLGVILTTPVPFDFPVITLDVARALTGQPYAQQGAPLQVEIRSAPGIAAGEGAVAQVVAAAIARQAHVAPGKVLLELSGANEPLGPRQFDMARRSYEQEMLAAARLYRDDDRFSPLVFGSFRAAMQLPDGRWRVVSRTPSEPQWQYGVAKGILIALLLMIPLAWWFSRALAAPIHALGDSANRIGSGEDHPVRVAGPREVRQAAEALNMMQARIRRNANERAEMLAAIAHDLRTPLARLRFLLADQPLSNHPQVDREIVEMSRMLETTMDYVRGESVRPQRERLDLRLMIETIVDELIDQGCDARLEPGPACTITADPVLLRRVFANVIDNAVTHGGSARISLADEGSQVAIAIADDGPGMADADIARAFDPFFRAERSRNRETGGIGLGLAIAARGVAAHGGSITIGSNQPGLIVRIGLPRSLH